MKILLVDPHFSDYAWNQDVAPPLGLLYIASAIKEKLFGIVNHHEVRVLPMQLYKVKNKHNIRNTFVSFLKDYRPKIVGIGTITPSITNAINLTKLAREYSPNSLIVLGGYQATVDYRNLLLSNKSIDVIVRGEGEKPFCKLVAATENNDLSNIKKIHGIAFRSGDGKIVTTPRQDQIIDDIDKLPVPDRVLVPMEEIKLLSGSYRAGGMITSRGCPWNCNMCCSSTMWNTGVYRSAESVVSEIEILVNAFGINKIRFEDDTFTADKKRVFKICKLIKERRIIFEWEARSRIDLADKKMFRRMRDAGLRRLQIGVETINDNSLGILSKNISVTKYENFFNLAREVGIGLIITVIIGLPFEKPKQMLNTIDWVKDHLTTKDRFIRCMYTPYEGTSICNNYNTVILSNNPEKYTMDIPLVTSDLFSLEELTNVKKYADTLMKKQGPEHTKNNSIPIDIENTELGPINGINSDLMN